MYRLKQNKKPQALLLFVSRMLSGKNPTENSLKYMHFIVMLCCSQWASDVLQSSLRSRFGLDYEPEHHISLPNTE